MALESLEEGNVLIVSVVSHTLTKLIRYPCFYGKKVLITLLLYFICVFLTNSISFRRCLHRVKGYGTRCSHTGYFESDREGNVYRSVDHSLSDEDTDK